MDRAWNKTAKSIRRSKLRFTRAPIEYNGKLLPKPDEYEGMNLAFREDFYERPDGSDFYAHAFVAVLFYIVFGLMAVTVVTTVVTSATIPFLAIGLAYLLAPVVRTRTYIGLHWLVALVVPFTGLIALMWLSSALIMRFEASLVIGLIALVCAYIVPGNLFRFYREWIYTFPRLRSESRKHAPELISQSNIPLLALLVAEIIFLPRVSPFWAFLAVLLTLYGAISLGPVGRYCAGAPLQRMKRVVEEGHLFLTECLTYGSRFHMPLPGVWQPKLNATIRSSMLLSLVSVFILLYALAFATFLPWDMPGVKQALFNTFERDVYSSNTAMAVVRTLAPEVHWAGVPDEETIGKLAWDAKVAEQKFITTVSLEEKDDARKDWVVARREFDQARSVQLTALADTLRTSPNAWIIIALTGIFNGHLSMSLLFPLAFILGCTLPILTLLAVCQGPLIELLELRDKVENEMDADADIDWDWFVSRLRTSEHQAQSPLPSLRAQPVSEREHLFLGLEAANGFPVLLSRKILHHHAYISGGSGSGKTSLGVLSLLVQLIRPWATSANGQSPQPEKGPASATNDVEALPPIVVIDLKGDYALLHTVMSEAKRRAEKDGRAFTDVFRLFSCEKGAATHRFNPFGDLATEDRSLTDLANLLCEAFELNHGPGYGRSFFSKVNFVQLRQLFEKGNITDLGQLNEALAELPGEERRRAYELIATVYALQDCEQLAIDGDKSETNAISMNRVIEDRQIAYFWLPVVETSMTARVVANLAIFSLFSAAYRRRQRREPTHQTYLFIDEFQNVAGAQFSVILEQAREWGLAAVLSNQSIAQLKQPAFDLRNTVKQNTRVKFYFAMDDEQEMQSFSARSGDELAYLRSGFYAPTLDEEPDLPMFEQWSHRLKPRVTTNDILKITDHPLQAYMELRQGDGYTQFAGAHVPIQMFYPLSQEQYTERSQTAPWPSAEELGVEKVIVAKKGREEIDKKITDELAHVQTVFEELYAQNPHLKKS
ncbi:type IV secretion system DNA-binding domain-containing protein [bacterium]|nr:type IV secretion system DNA-binding domain-containing protein [bacterium]